jgi:F0F1-type ATP synthase membrane subunit a
MGPTVLAIGIAVLLNISALPALAEQIAHDAALVFLSGILLLVAGLAVVRVHNRWQAGWPVVVTILGWVCLISGLARLLLPTQLARIAGSAVQNTSMIVAVALVLVAVGAFLSFKAYGER